ncbi:tail fiber domain-containing protein [archaeon]|nr:MAG: tail fiber domain-containing protein [archaeon]
MDKSAGDIVLSSGNSLSSGSGGSIDLSAGAGSSRGGDISLRAAAGDLTFGEGGSLTLQAGSGYQDGKVQLLSGQAESSLSLSRDGLSFESSQIGSKVLLTVPLVKSVDGSPTLDSMIELGFSRGESGAGDKKIDLRMQSTRNQYGKDTSMIVATAPIQATTVQYSSDIRIKSDIQPVNENSILQRILKIPIRSYRYTDEWLKVRDDIPDVRVRGVIAQELAEVFPEYVTAIPEYHLEDKNFYIKDFHQVDKTSLIVDLIAAVQAQARRFAIGQDDEHRSGNVKLSSSSWNEVVADDRSSMIMSGNVLISTGDADQERSGDVLVGTGDSVASAAGKISIQPGKSGADKAAAVQVMGGESVGAEGGSVEVRSGKGSLRSGAVAIETAASAEQSGSVRIASGSAISSPHCLWICYFVR